MLDGHGKYDSTGPHSFFFTGSTGRFQLFFARLFSVGWPGGGDISTGTKTRRVKAGGTPTHPASQPPRKPASSLFPALDPLHPSTSCIFFRPLDLQNWVQTGQKPVENQAAQLKILVNHRFFAQLASFSFRCLCGFAFCTWLDPEFWRAFPYQPKFFPA